MKLLTKKLYLMNANREVKKALQKEVIKEINKAHMWCAIMMDEKSKIKIKSPNQMNVSVIAVLLFSNPDLHEYINDLIKLMKAEKNKTKLENKQ